MMLSKLLRSTALASFSCCFVSVANAQDLLSVSTVTIHSNTDDSPHYEPINMYVAGQLQAVVDEGGTRVVDNLSVDGAIYDTDDSTVDIGENLRVAGDVLVDGAIYDTNDSTVDIGEHLRVNGNLYLNGDIIDVTGDNLVTVNDDFEVTGSSELKATSIIGTTSITGTTAINTTGTNNTSIGNANTNTTVIGTTSVTGTTTINTTGTNNTSIGNANTNTTVVGTTSVTGTTAINTTGGADTTIGVSGNKTSILSTSVVVGNSTTSSNISVGTGAGGNTITMGNQVNSTSISAAAGNTAMSMQNGSIVNKVIGEQGVSAGAVVANNGSTRWVTDANGALIEVDATDTTSGTTAAMVVTNSAGNTHGLVVQETKTTLSGGTNSSSMTLADNGATFSNSANGAPIQVHGVADGTADFDAVNVRQLYSGLAAVLAASPDLNLAPGKSSAAFGFGHYGGFSAVGFSIGHMYNNGAIVSASVSKAPESEPAVKAGISWTW